VVSICSKNRCYSTTLAGFNSNETHPYYYLGTVPFLIPGDHTAKVAVKRVDGSVVEYEWRFRITWW
jgi:hypothetical protein